MPEISFEDMLGVEKKEISFEDMIGKKVSFEDMLGIETKPIKPTPEPPSAVKSELVGTPEVTGLAGTPWEGVSPLAGKMGLDLGFAKPDPLKQSVMDTLKGAAKDVGMEAVAVTELTLSLASGMLLYIPSKLYGAAALPFGRAAADIAEEEMAKLGYQPFTERGRQAAELVGRGFELFLTPARNIGEVVSRLNEEAGYLVEFGVELAEFIMTGGIVKGVRAKFKPSIKQIDKLVAAKEKLESDTIKAKEQAVEQIPDEILKEAQRKVVEVEKVQAALEVVELKKSVDYDLAVKEELKVKGEEVKAVKEKVEIVREPSVKAVEPKPIPPEEIPDIKREPKRIKVVEPPKISKKTNKLIDEYETLTERADKISEDVMSDAQFEEFKEIQGRLREVGQELYKSELITDRVAELKPDDPRFDVVREPEDYRVRQLMDDRAKRDVPIEVTHEDGRYIVTDGTHRLEAKRRLGEPVEVKVTEGIHEAVTELDRQTGVDVPGLEGERSPFYQNPEVTETYRRLFEGREKAVKGDPELYTQKLINDVNRWIGGEEVVDIGATRNALSTLATRADELRMDFLDGTDHLKWKETVSDAAEWARKVEPLRFEIKRRPGPKLYTGVPIEEMKELISKSAKATMEAGRRARELKRFRPIAGAKAIKRALKRDWAEKGANIRLDLLKELGQEGYEILQKSILIKGADPLSGFQVNQMMKELTSGLTRNEKRIWGDLIFNTRMAAIAKYKTPEKFKFPKGSNPTESALYIDLFDTKAYENISPDRAAKIRTSVDGYFEWMKRPLENMRESGLISEQEMIDLSSHKYSKLKLVDILKDERYESKVGKKPITVYDSGIQVLAKGRETDILERNPEILALETFSRANGRVFRNDANNSLYELSLKDPKNPFARSVEGSRGEGIPSGWSRIYVFREGQRKSLHLSPEMAREWITNNPEISYRSGMYLRWASGAPVLKMFATGIEWGFALANVPRDVMHLFYTARVFDRSKWKSLYSSNLPIFLPQIGMDIARVFPDVVTKGPKWEKYAEHGGLMDFLVLQGQLFRKGRKIGTELTKVQDLLGKFGMISEGMTRLAIVERVIKRRAREEGISIEEARKNKKIVDEAVFAARDYLDFGQGGGQAKAADNALPYLNATIQATRGMLGAARDNPITFAWKTVQIGAATTAVYAAAKAFAPKTTEALKGSYNMQNNLCIPVGDESGFEDEKGQMRYWGFKMPLDPTQKFFKAFFESSYDMYTGAEPDVERVINTFNDLSPVGLSQLPPTLSGTLGYMANKDFWRMEDIERETFGYFTMNEKGKWVGSSQEFDEYTSRFAIDVGERTRLSPGRLQFAAEELVTGNSMWFFLMGKGYDELFKDVPKNQREQHWAMVLSRTPVINRFIFVTNPYSKYASDIEAREGTDALERHVQNRELDRLTDGYLFTKSVERSEIRKYIRSFRDVDIQDRLNDRFDYQYAIRKLPERSFWLRLSGLNVKPRAQSYYDRWSKANEEERKQLAREVARIGAAGKVLTSGFWDEFNRIRRKGSPE